MGSFFREGSNEHWKRILAQPPVRGTDAPWPTTLEEVIDLDTYEPAEGWIDLTKQADNGIALNPSVEAGVVNALQEECGRTAAEHGFSDDWESANWLEKLADDMDPGDADKLRDIAAMLRNNILGTKLMLIVSEISEGMESLRKNAGAAGALQGFGNLPEELADAIVRILDTGTFIKANLGDELLRKMAVNSDRPFMHGDKAM